MPQKTLAAPVRERAPQYRVRDSVCRLAGDTFLSFAVESHSPAAQYSKFRVASTPDFFHSDLTDRRPMNAPAITMPFP
jgi:hypothetical protein